MKERYGKDLFHIPHSPVVTGTDARYTPYNYYYNPKYDLSQATGRLRRDDGGGGGGGGGGEIVTHQPRNPTTII
jgi:hypothetical protein